MNTSPFTEYKQVRQEPGGRRRWFQSPQGDLMVWYAADGSVSGLQFCHHEGIRERVYTWRPSTVGWRQQVVDEGSRPPMMHVTPLLVDAEAVAMDSMRQRISAGLAGLEPELAETVERAITP